MMQIRTVSKRNEVSKGRQGTSEIVMLQIGVETVVAVSKRRKKEGERERERES